MPRPNAQRPVRPVVLVRLNARTPVRPVPSFVFLVSFVLLLPRVLLPSTLLAQDPRLRARLDPPTVARVEALVDSAKRSGLPVEPLIQKALEGNSKGASPDRIVSAVGLLLGALGEARSGLGGGSSSEELVAGALWIRAGGGSADLAALRHAASGNPPSLERPLVLPIAISADLVARGWPRAEAFASVEKLLQARVPDNEFIALRDRVDRAVRNGGRLVPAVRAEIARLTNAPEKRP